MTETAQIQRGKMNKPEIPIPLSEMTREQLEESVKRLLKENEALFKTVTSLRQKNQRMKQELNELTK
jgi:predicted RNase H-like nuclease (RuvC/YqgF family)